MRRDDNAYLLDMLLAAKQIKEFISGLSWESFKTSRLHQFAITRSLEIIGEASQRVGTATRKAHPEIPWGKMNGMRNKIIHEYFQIDLETVWDTASKDIQ